MKFKIGDMVKVYGRVTSILSGHVIFANGDKGIITSDINHDSLLYIKLDGSEAFMRLMGIKL